MQFTVVLHNLNYTGTQSGGQDGGQNGTQGGTQDDSQGDTQDDTQGDTQGIDAIIIQEIRKNPQITTEELAQIANKGIATIKRHIAKLSDVRYVGSGYSGHWEIISTD